MNYDKKFLKHNYLLKKKTVFCYEIYSLNIVQFNIIIIPELITLY